MVRVKAQINILQKLLTHIEDGRASEAVQDWHSLMSNTGRCLELCQDGKPPEVDKCANCLNAKLLHTCETQRQKAAHIANDCYLASTRLMRWLDQSTK